MPPFLVTVPLHFSGGLATKPDAALVLRYNYWLIYEMPAVTEQVR